MAVSERVSDATDHHTVELSAHSTSPDRTVFIEPGNSEAWLSTDLTVSCER